MNLTHPREDVRIVGLPPRGRLRSIFLAMLLFMVAASPMLFMLGCPATQNTQAATANAIANGANAALPMLVDAYRQEGLKAIAKAPTREAAEAELIVIDARWSKVWTAWNVLRVAEDTWATAIETGGDTAAALAGMRTAYCGLQTLWPKEIPAMPIVPIVCGGTP